MLLSCSSAPRVESSTTSPAKRARTRRGKGMQQELGGAGRRSRSWSCVGGSLASGAPGNVSVMPIGCRKRRNPDLLAYSQIMPPERDLFANFERMRREMDELFGDVFDRTGLAPRKRGGFSPGGRRLLRGRPAARASSRPSWRGSIPTSSRSRSTAASSSSPGTAGRPTPRAASTSSSRSTSGPFRRVIQLGADVVADAARATYRDGILRIELPLVRPESRTRSVRSRSRERRGTMAVHRHRRRGGRGATSRSAAAPASRDAAGPAAARDRPAPRHADAARGRPGALGRSSSTTSCAGNRMLVMVASRDPDKEVARARRPVRGRRGRRDRAHDQGPRRDAAHPRPGRSARAHRQLGGRDALPGRRDRRAARRGARRVGRARGADAQRPADVLRDRREQSLPPRGAAARDRQHRRPERAQPPDRRLAAPEDRGEAGAARGGRRRPAPAPPGRASSRASSRSSRSGSEIQSQVQSEIDKGQREFVLRQQLEAIQQRAGRVRRVGRARPTSCASSSTRIALPEEVRRQVDRELKRLEALPPQAAEHGVIRTYLEWIASLPWDKTHRGQPRPRARARGARRGPLRHRAGQGPHPRVPGRAQAQAATAAAARSCASSGRPAWARPRSGRSIARALGRKFERISAGRRARRGRDPRPPAHLHRRDARHDHPRAARRGVQQPALHDRRDRQDGRRLPRRSRQRDARGARPRAELRPSATTTSTCRSTSRTSCSSPRQHARHDPRAAARPHGGHRARRLHRGGEARDRQALPGAAPDRAQRPEEVVDLVLGRRAARRSSATTRARRACATSSARSAPSAARSRRQAAESANGKPPRTTISDAARARAAGPPALHLGGQAPHPRAGRGHRAGVDARRRRRALHRGDGVRRGTAS